MNELTTGAEAPEQQIPQIPQSSNRGNENLDFSAEIRKMLTTAGTLELTKEQNDILFAPLKDNEIYIKPDGLIYLTWTKYASRLSRAFGTSWTLVPQGMPKISDNNLIIWGFHLIVKGIYCGFSIGEQQYHDNKRMSYGEACEGAKSNALTRLCKSLGIGLELWDKQFINEWLSKYADKKWDQQAGGGRGRYEWFLKPNAFANMEKQPRPTASSETQSATPPTTPPVETSQNYLSKKEQIITKTEKSEDVKIKVEIPKFKENKVENKVEAKITKSGPKSKKLAENNDFLKLEKIEEAEIEETTKEITPLENAVDNAKTTGQLKMAYEAVKNAYTNGEISEELKEQIRQKANKLFVKLSSEGK
jgi:hypothetical protein